MRFWEMSYTRTDRSHDVARRFEDVFGECLKKCSEEMPSVGAFSSSTSPPYMAAIKRKNAQARTLSGTLLSACAQEVYPGRTDASLFGANMLLPVTA